MINPDMLESLIYRLKDVCNNSSNCNCCLLNTICRNDIYFYEWDSDDINALLDLIDKSNK